MVIIDAFLIIHRLWQVNHDPTFPLEFWEASTISLQGFINAIIYGATPRGRKLMRSFFENIKKMFKKNREFIRKSISNERVPLLRSDNKTSAMQSPPLASNEESSQLPLLPIQQQQQQQHSRIDERLLPMGAVVNQPK